MCNLKNKNYIKKIKPLSKDLTVIEKMPKFTYIRFSFSVWRGTHMNPIRKEGISNFGISLNSLESTHTVLYLSCFVFRSFFTVFVWLPLWYTFRCAIGAGVPAAVS